MEMAPQLTHIMFCGNCGLRFFDRGLSTDEAARYYREYRSDKYCAARNRCEPFYTTRIHREISSWLGSPQRRQALADVLSRNGGIGNFNSILDFGGGDGTLIVDLDAEERAVLDPSGTPPVAGVVRISDDASAARQWDLIVCAQVLEHLTDPRLTIGRLGSLLAPGGRLYLEVPDETWDNRTFAGAFRDRWLAWLLAHPTLLVAGDVISTACRIKLGTLPPFGFIPMREHLQYFTEEALCAIIEACGLDIIRSGRNSVGQIYAVAARLPPAMT